MQRPILRWAIRFALIALLLLLVAGTVIWLRLPVLIERQVVRRLEAAGFPGTRLRVETVGLRRIEVLDVAVSGGSWELVIREGTARYHPFELLRSELRSVHLEGLRIDLDLESAGPSPRLGPAEVAAWRRWVFEASALFPLRTLSITNGLLCIQQGQREVTFPFTGNLTNDQSIRQVRVEVQGANAQGQVQFEGRVDPNDGLRIDGQFEGMLAGLHFSDTSLAAAVIPTEIMDADTRRSGILYDWIDQRLPGVVPWLRNVGFELTLSAESVELADGARIARPTLRVQQSATVEADAEPAVRFAVQAAAVHYAAFRLSDARGSGAITGDGVRVDGNVSLGQEPIPYQFDLGLTNLTPAGPELAGDVSVGTIRFDEYQPPLEWSGGKAMRITGEMAAASRFHWVPGGAWSMWPELGLALEKIEWPEAGLTVEGVRGDLSAVSVVASDAPATNLVRIDRIRYGELEALELTFRVSRLGEPVLELELVSAQLLGGRAWMPAFRLDRRSAELEAVLEFEQVSLASLAGLLPRFGGSIEGGLSGRLPIHLDADGLVLGTTTLELDRSRPAWLRYPAAGLLTRGVPASSERYRQLQLVERALGNLRLTELSIDLYSPEHPRTPVRLRLEGTFSSADAVIPVKFNLNVSGDLDPALRLLRMGEIELNL